MNRILTICALHNARPSLFHAVVQELNDKLRLNFILPSIMPVSPERKIFGKCAVQPCPAPKDAVLNTVGNACQPSCSCPTDSLLVPCKQREQGKRVATLCEFS